MGFFRNTKQPKRVDEAVTESEADPEGSAAVGPGAPAGDEQEAGGLDTRPIDHNEGIAKIICPAY